MSSCLESGYYGADCMCAHGGSGRNRALRPQNTYMDEGLCSIRGSSSDAGVGSSAMMMGHRAQGVLAAAGRAAVRVFRGGPHALSASPGPASPPFPVSVTFTFHSTRSALNATSVPSTRCMIQPWWTTDDDILGLPPPPQSVRSAIKGAGRTKFA